MITSETLSQLKHVQTLGAHDSPNALVGALSKIELSADGLIMMTLAYKELRVWDVRSGAILFSRDGYVNDVALHPDGEWIAVVENNYDNLIHIVDIKTGEVIYKLIDDPVRLSHLTISPDGTQLAYVLHDERQVIRVNIADWQIIKKRKLRYHIASVSFNDDCTRFAVSCLQERNPRQGTHVRETHIWELPSGKQHTIQDKGHGNTTLAPNGQVIVINGHLYQVESGQPQHEIGYGVTRFTADSQIALNYEYDQLRFHDMNTGDPIHTLPAHKPYIGAFAINRDSNVLAVNSGGSMPGGRPIPSNGVTLWQVDE